MVIKVIRKTTLFRVLIKAYKYSDVVLGEITADI